MLIKRRQHNFNFFIFILQIYVIYLKLLHLITQAHHTLHLRLNKLAELAQKMPPKTKR